jgi:DNA-binding CsgD family transcriptional regulator
VDAIDGGFAEHKLASAVVGRDEQLGLIRSLVVEAADGGAVLLLTGEPGVGKTVLLDAAAEAAAAAGTRVLRAAGVEFEADVSYSGLHQVLFPLLAEFGQLGALQRDALNLALGFGEGPPSGRLVVGNAVLTLLRLSAQAQPLLVIVDDLPWVDRPSALVLGFAARRLSGSRVGFLAASRIGEESFFERAGLPTYEVPPLDGEAAAALLNARFPALTARVRQRVLADSQGNPLALLELPTVWSGPQQAVPRVLPTVLPLSQRLQAVFASRTTSLPAPTRELLLLAVLDGTGDLRILEAADKHCLDHLGPAERTRLVHVDQVSGRLAFRHPLIRSALVEMSTIADRRRAHAVLAGLQTDQLERHAWHLAEAASGPDEETASLLEQAAHQTLRRGDAVGAVAALRRAADMSPSRSERSRRIAKAAHIGADVAGDLHNVSQLLDDARQADPELSGSLYAAIAASFVLLNGDGDVDAAHDLLAGAIEALADPGDAEDNNMLVEALYTLELLCFFGGRPELWEPFYAAIKRLGPDVPAVLELQAKICADPARTAIPALFLLEAEISRLRGEADPTKIVRTAIAATFADRLAGCREALWRVVRDSREGGAITSGMEALTSLCVDSFMAGRWDQAGELADEAIRLSEAFGYGLLAWSGLWCKAVIAAGRGDVATVDMLADEMTRWAVPRRMLMVQHYCQHAKELAALGRGDYEAAYQHATAITPPGTLASHIPVALWVCMDIVEAAVRTGRHADAAAHVAAMNEARIGEISPRLALVAAGSAAIAAPQDEAAELFDRALAIPGAGRWPFDFARIQLACGERLRRARATAEARKHLAAALAIFEHLGAQPWALRANSELRASGHAPREAGYGITSLTPREREIARLAAAGLSNKQIGERLFLTHRTVAAHLYQIFPKLGVTSRAALHAAIASAQQPEEHNPSARLEARNLRQGSIRARGNSLRASGQPSIALAAIATARERGGLAQIGMTRLSSRPMMSCPNRSRFVRRYFRFSGVGGTTRASRAATRSPNPSRAFCLPGLLVSSLIDRTPRFARIWAATE